VWKENIVEEDGGRGKEARRKEESGCRNLSCRCRCSDDEPTHGRCDHPHEVTACATGKFHENGGCTDCPAGRWQEPNNHWLTRCKECPAGRYSASGASTCTDCAVGMYTNQNEQQTCRDCGVGFFQDRTRVSFTKITVKNDNDKTSTHDRMFLLKRPTRASIVYLGSSLIR